MSDNYFKTGLENLKKIDGTAGSNVIENLSDIAPDLARYIIEFAFGQIYERPGLSLQERELLTLSSLLTAGGCEAQLQVHIYQRSITCWHKRRQNYRSISALHTLYGFP